MRCQVLLYWLSHYQGLEKGFALLGTLIIVVNFTLLHLLSVTNFGAISYGYE